MSKRRLSTILVLSLLFLATWLPRMLVLDAFVTVDERKWLNRSGNFYWALAQGEWGETFQQAHPGVTVTWTGLLAFLQAFPDYLQQVAQPISDNALESMLWQNGSLTPLSLLAAGRWWMILIISLAVAAMYLPLRKLYCATTAIVAVCFVAWSPFFLGLSHHLHPDGPLAALCTLSLLLFLAWLYGERQYRYLISSGIFFGLALLTKTPAVAVGLTAGLLALVETIRQRQSHRERIISLWGGMIVWGLLALSILVLLWPVMWVDPFGALRQIYDQMQGYRVEGHSLPSYFMGQVVDDPGWRFYPTVLWLRMNPVSLIGLGLALYSLLAHKQPYNSEAARWATLGNLLFSIIIIFLASISAKKFDRYIMPAFLTLNIVAATGWVSLVDYLKRLWQTHDRSNYPQRLNLSRWLGGTVLAMLIVAQGLPAFLQYPYYALAFNPLAGGKSAASETLMIGWGEGLDEIGRWLSSQQGDEPLQVVSWYEQGPLSYYLPGDSRLMSFIESDNYWFEADYVILYANQWQRENPDPEMIRHFLNQEPIFDVNANGVALAKVYDNRDVAPPPFTKIYTGSEATFDDNLRLAAYRLPRQSITPGEEIDITLLFAANSSIEQNYSALARLVDDAGNILWQEQRWPSKMPTVGWSLGEIRPDRYEVLLPVDAPIGEYTFELSVLDESGEVALPVESKAAADGDTVRGDTVRVATIEVQAPQPVAVDVRWAPVSIASLAHAPAIMPGQTLLVNLDATGLGGAPKISLRLIDPNGKTQAQQDKELSDTLRFELAVPVGVPLGQYDLSIVVYDGETAESYPDQHGETPTTVSYVDVLDDPR